MSTNWLEQIKGGAPKATPAIKQVDMPANKASRSPTIEPELIDSKQLAMMLSVSRKFIEKHRHNIAGSIKIAGCWRFKLRDIRQRIATGQDVVAKQSSL